MRQRDSITKTTTMDLCFLFSIMAIGCSGSSEEQVAQAVFATAPIVSGIEEVVKETGPIREGEGWMVAAGAIRYRVGDEYQYGVFIAHYGAPDERYEVDIETAKRFRDVFKNMEQNKKPLDPNITHTVVILKFRNLQGTQCSFTQKIFLDKERVKLDGTVDTIEQALADVESLKAAKASYVPTVE